MGMEVLMTATGIGGDPCAKGDIGRDAMIRPCQPSR
jgi:hypothetical protein